MRLFIILLISISIGCAKKENKASTKPPQTKGTISTAIDGFTGKTAVQAGKKAQNDIHNVSSNANKNLNEILN